MGVELTHYLVLGAKLPDELLKKIDIWAEKYEPYYCGAKDVEFSLIADGMCGNYAVFGKVIIAFDGRGDDFQKIKIELAPGTGVRFLETYYQLFGEWPVEMGYLAFTHAS